MEIPDLIGMIFLQLFLVLLNAFFASTEIAILQLNHNKLRKLAEEGDKAAPRILKLVESPSNFLSTIQIGITLANALGSAFAASNFADPLSSWLYNDLNWQFLGEKTLNTIVVIVITLILSYVMLVIGELVPKQLALRKPYEIAKVTSGIIAGIAVVAKPFVTLLSASTRVVLRLFGVKSDRTEEIVTEDEIRMMVDVGHESGTIDSEEKEMIDSVFELDKTIARDIMTHRVDVVTLEADADTEEVLNTISESGLSRIPVYDDSLDNILGILNIRTYLLNLRSKNPKTVREMLREAYFVPETVPAAVLLREMQSRKNHLALVVDEYGGFSGLVTMEDVIEEIVGNIYDEFDHLEEPEIEEIGDNLWRIAGDTDIETIEDALDISLPAEREYDSLGGLVFSCLSSIPHEGAEVSVDILGLHIETGPVKDHHIEWANVSIIKEPVSEDESSEGTPSQP